MANTNDSSERNDIDAVLRAAQPTHLSEEHAPVVDIEKLVALARGELSPEAARFVDELCASFKSWDDAYTQVLVDECANAQAPPHTMPTSESGGGIESLSSDTNAISDPTIPLLQDDAAEAPIQASGTPMAYPWQDYRLYATLAATFLLGLVVGNLDRWFAATSEKPEVMLAQAELEPVRVLDSEPFQPIVRNPAGSFEVAGDFDLRLQSPRTGFATVLLLGESSAAVFPRVGQEPIHVQRFEPLPYGPLPAPEEKSVLLVVVTESPISASVQERLKRISFEGLNPSAREKEIVNALGSEARPWVAMQFFTVVPKQ